MKVSIIAYNCINSHSFYKYYEKDLWKAKKPFSTVSVIKLFFCIILLSIYIYGSVCFCQSEIWFLSAFPKKGFVNFRDTVRTLFKKKMTSKEDGLLSLL